MGASGSKMHTSALGTAVSCHRSRAGAELGARPAGNVPVESSLRPLVGGPQLSVVEIVLSSCCAGTRTGTHGQALAGSVMMGSNPGGGLGGAPWREGYRAESGGV